MTSALVAFRRRANSPTVISSGTVMVMAFALRSAAMRLSLSASVSRFALRGLPRRWLFWLIFCFAATVSFFTLSYARRSYFSLCRSIVARLVVLRRTLRLILLCVLVSVIAVIVAAIVIFVAIIIVIHVLLLRLLRVLSGFFARLFRCFLGRLLFGLCRIARCKVRVKVLCGMILREAVKNDIELVFF